MTIGIRLAVSLMGTTALWVAVPVAAWAQERAPQPGQAEAVAADAPATGLADIVVTASRRETNVQDVPIAITAVSGEQLASQGITDGIQLTRVTPNLFATTGYAGGNPRFSIRGFGMTDFSQGGSSPVAIYVDDVYQAYSFGIGSQLYDLNRVEVLRGPQGTLFGKNTTAGTIAYFSERPRDDFEGYVNGDIRWGEYGKYMLEGVINAPLAENLNMRAGGRYEHRDSYVDNVFDGSQLGKNDLFSGRVQFELAASDATTVNLKLYGMNSDGDSTLYHGGFIQNICDPANFDPANTPYANCNGSELPPTYETPGATADETGSFEKYYNYGATLRIEHELSDWGLTSISAYQKIDYKILTNDDGNSTDFFHSRQELDAWQISQEVRAASPADRPVGAILGLFAMYDKALTPTATGSTFFGPGSDYMLRTDSDQKTTTLAAFTNLTFKITDQLSFIGGLRYSYEKKKINLQGIEVFNFTYDFTDDNMADFDIANPPFVIDPVLDNPFSQVETNSWDRLTWDATLNYKPTDDVMIYVKAAEGFRSGGYNLFASTETSVATVEPEILRSYEIGIKTELFDRKVRLNTAAFHYKITDQQILSTNSSGAGVILSNAGKSTIDGFEIELEAAPVPALHLNASVGYTDATFDSFDTVKAGVPVSLKGNTLAYAPKWTAAIGGSYDVDVGGGYTLQLQSDWNYRSKIYFDSFNLPFTGDDDFLQGNARITLNSPEEGTQWHVAAYVSNLTNETNKAFAFFTGNAWYSHVFGDRRIWGLQAGVKF